MKYYHGGTRIKTFDMTPLEGPKKLVIRGLSK